MKIKLLRLIITMSKLATYGILLQTLFFSLLLAENSEAQKIERVYDVHLNLNLNDAKIIDVFQEIESKTDFHFSFDISDIESDVKINYRKDNATVADALLKISKFGNLKFKQVNNYITVKKFERGEKQKIEIVIQGISVTGKVTSTEDTEGLPGVNVVVKGTSIGTVTDVEGNYALEVPAENSILVFSSVGFLTEEFLIGNKTIIDFTLTPDITQLSEIVVTALGVERDVKALQYSVTTIDGDNFTKARENNITNQLAGRIAGVNVSKTSSGPGGSTRVIIRGNTSLQGNNQPLYVVDGLPIDNSGFGQAGMWGGSDEGDGMTSISPDDIESITVLKGASAAALYGARAANGVVNITTKKGSNRKGIGVSFQSNYTVEKAVNFLDVQTEYGTGGFVNGVSTKATTQSQAYSWGNDSWGPRFDGQPVVMWDGISRPYESAGDNWNRFFEPGQALTNSIAFTGGNADQNFRVSISDLRSNSIIPNAGYNRTNISISANSKLGKKLTLGAKLLYSREDVKNRPGVADTPSNSFAAISRMPDNFNLDWLKGDPNKLGAIPQDQDEASLLLWGKLPGEEMPFSSSKWTQNPWWTAYQKVNSDIRDRVIASVDLRYDITDNIYVKGRIGMDWYTRREQALIAQGTGYRRQGTISEGERRIREVNAEWMVGYNESFGRLNVNAFVGGNKMTRSNEVISANGTGFNVPFFAAINNAAARNYGYGYSENGINSLFGSAELGWDGYLFLTATVRKDWFSVVNPENNSALYPSVGASWVFSDNFQALPSWFSFGKARVSWAQVGNVTISPYRANLAYSLRADTHLGRPLAGFSSGNTIPNPSLIPYTSNEIEVGFDLRFLQNRLGVDFAYYNQETTDDILNAGISGTSGFTATTVNLGKMTNNGVEILLTGTPIQGEFNWDIAFNFSKNNNKVVSLIEGSDELSLAQSRTRSSRIKHIVGYPFGMVTARVQQMTDDGRPVYTELGLVQGASEYEILGNGVPDFTGGLNNTFSYKGFNLSFLIDFKSGGVIHSGTNANLLSWGRHKATVQGREGNPAVEISGVYQSGSDGDGNPTYTEKTWTLTEQPASDYWWSVGSRDSRFVTYDASYGKLRQLTFGYSFPRSLIGDKIQSLSLSFVGRNLAYLWKNTENISPEAGYSNGNSQGLENIGTPETRSYGFNVKVEF